MLDALQLAFVQRALLAGLMVGLLASYYGVFVVQRGLSFLGSGLAHSAFGGVALGILLGIQPLAVAVPFTIIVAMGIVWLQQRTRLGADTSVGIFFSVSMALGVIFLTMTPRYTTDAFTYLFGSILYVTWGDIAIMGFVMLMSIFTWKAWGRWAYATFDRELALSDTVACRRDDYLLSFALAASTVISIKVVGIALIAAFLVIPPATARLLTRTFSAMTILSMVFGVFSVLVGMVVSLQADIPTGPAIILTQAVIFFVIALARRGG
ncbi:MAG: metal ABC transporter permease [Candidatus Sumerlaeia bacterium]|nr:metal ABC transporter permease [Candidatus Sumerlaeia bacterium]